jgi:tetratricopeptide (TPR) repeat protein
MSEQIEDNFIEDGTLEFQEHWGKPSAFIALAILMPLALWLIYQTNLGAIHANIIIKRSQFFEASANFPHPQQQEYLNVAIALREQAIHRDPLSKNFYLAGLGYLYAKKAGLESNEDLFQKAVSISQQAIDIDPLHPDHSANMARVYFYFAEATNNQDKKRELFEDAISYYNEAIALMPANLNVRFERSNFLINGLNDCSRGLGYYLVDTENESPPSYAAYQTLAGFYATCADMEPQFQRVYRRLAIEHLEKSILLTANFPPKDHRNLWWDLADYRARLMGDFDGAIAAYEEVRALTIADDPYSRDYALWKIDLAMAKLHWELKGNRERALELALRAEENAPGQPDELTAFIEMLNAIDK